MSEKTFEQIMAIKGGEPLPDTSKDLDQPFEYDPDLYREMRDFNEAHLDVIEDVEYDVFTLKQLETWFFPKFRQLSYLYLIGVPSTGKTRALETAAQLSFNPIMGATMTTPVPGATARPRSTLPSGGAKASGNPIA